MAKSQQLNIAQEDIANYAKDGVVCLKGVLDVRWIDQLMEAWREMEARMKTGKSDYDLPEALLANDPALKAEVDYMNTPGNAPVGIKPGFMSCKWTYFWNDKIRDFVHNSPAAEIVGRTLDVDYIRFFWDQMFVKKHNTGVPTVWHTDQPAWPTRGEHLPSMWVPLAPVDKALSSLEYLAGSHKTYDPRDWPGTFNGTLVDLPEGRKAFTDWEEHRGREDLRFLAYDCGPGDAVLFNPKLYHGAGANNHPTQDRIAISLRWMGPDITWDPRPECVNIPGAPLATLKAGERPDNDELFPIIWQRAQTRAA